MYRLCFIYIMYSSFLVECSNKTKLYYNMHIFFLFEFSLVILQKPFLCNIFPNFINDFQTLLIVNNKNKLPTSYSIILYCYREKNMFELHCILLAATTKLSIKKAFYLCFLIKINLNLLTDMYIKILSLNVYLFVKLYYYYVVCSFDSIIIFIHYYCYRVC